MTTSSRNAVRAKTADGSKSKTMDFSSPEDELARPSKTTVNELQSDQIRGTKRKRSTLIEFPGTSRKSKPLWRQELSQRVREIQERRAREAEETSGQTVESPDSFVPGYALELVATTSDTVDINPIVAKALKRVEKARQQPVPAPRNASGRSGAAALARVTPDHEPELTLDTGRVEPGIGDIDLNETPLSVELPRPVTERKLVAVTPVSNVTAATVASQEDNSKQIETISPDPVPTVIQVTSAPQAPEQAAPAPLEVVAPPKPVVKPIIPKPAPVIIRSEASGALKRSSIAAARTPAAPMTREAPATNESEKAPRKVVECVVDDAYLSKLEAQLLPAVQKCEPLENFAPLGRRLTAGVVDLLIAVFLASPSAAIMELTNSNWADSRVQITMASIFLLVLFLYQTVCFGLSGKTCGMSLFSLRAVDSKTGVHPSTMQSIGRSILYIGVVLTGFLGTVTALFDGEKRTVHDMLTRTVVIAD